MAFSASAMLDLSIKKITQEQKAFITKIKNNPMTVGLLSSFVNSRQDDGMYAIKYEDTLLIKNFKAFLNLLTQIQKIDQATIKKTTVIATLQNLQNIKKIAALDFRIQELQFYRKQLESIYPSFNHILSFILKWSTDSLYTKVDQIEKYWHHIKEQIKNKSFSLADAKKLYTASSKPTTLPFIAELHFKTQEIETKLKTLLTEQKITFNSLGLYDTEQLKHDVISHTALIDMAIAANAVTRLNQTLTSKEFNFSTLLNEINHCFILITNINLLHFQDPIANELQQLLKSSALIEIFYNIYDFFYDLEKQTGIDLKPIHNQLNTLLEKIMGKEFQRREYLRLEKDLEEKSKQYALFSEIKKNIESNKITTQTQIYQLFCIMDDIKELKSFDPDFFLKKIIKIINQRLGLHDLENEIEKTVKAIKEFKADPKNRNANPPDNKIEKLRKLIQMRFELNEVKKIMQKNPDYPGKSYSTEKGIIVDKLLNISLKPIFDADSIVYKKFHLTLTTAVHVLKNQIDKSKTALRQLSRFSMDKQADFKILPSSASPDVTSENKLKFIDADTDLAVDELLTSRTKREINKIRTTIITVIQKNPTVLDQHQIKPLFEMKSERDLHKILPDDGLIIKNLKCAFNILARLDQIESVLIASDLKKFFDMDNIASNGLLSLATQGIGVGISLRKLADEIAALGEDVSHFGYFAEQLDTVCSSELISTTFQLTELKGIFKSVFTQIDMLKENPVIAEISNKIVPQDHDGLASVKDTVKNFISSQFAKLISSDVTLPDEKQINEKLILLETNLNQLKHYNNQHPKMIEIINHFRKDYIKLQKLVDSASKLEKELGLASGSLADKIKVQIRHYEKLSQQFNIELTPIEYANKKLLEEQQLNRILSLQEMGLREIERKNNFVENKLLINSLLSTNIPRKELTSLRGLFKNLVESSPQSILQYQKLFSLNQDDELSLAKAMLTESENRLGNFDKVSNKFKSFFNVKTKPNIHQQIYALAKAALENPASFIHQLQKKEGMVEPQRISTVARLKKLIKNPTIVNDDRSQLTQAKNKNFSISFDELTPKNVTSENEIELITFKSFR